MTFFATVLLIRFPEGISAEGAVKYRDDAVKSLQEAGFEVTAAIGADGSGIEEVTE